MIDWNARYAERPDIRGTGQIDLPAGYNSWLYRRRRRVLRRALHRQGISVAGRDVCEAAAGIGMWVPFWRSQRPRSVRGGDMSETAVHSLNARHGPGFKVWNLLDDPPFAPASFDIVTVFDAIFLIPGDDAFYAVISDLLSLLRPNGYLIVSDWLGNSNLDRAYLHYRGRAAWEEVCDGRARIVSCDPQFGIALGSLTGPSTGLARLADVVLRTVRATAQLPWAGHVLGAMAYAADCLLLPWLARGPSLHLALIQRSGPRHARSTRGPLRQPRI
jgi:SAM-dependent methyltransferase